MNRAIPTLLRAGVTVLLEPLPDHTFRVTLTYRDRAYTAVEDYVDDAFAYAHARLTEYLIKTLNSSRDDSEGGADE